MPPIMAHPLPLFFGGTGVIEGTVQDAESGAGIVGATVFLKEAGVADGKSGSGGYIPERPVYSTDAGGVFRISGLRDRRYHLDVEAPGFLRYLACAVASVARSVPHRLNWDLGITSNLASGYWRSDWSKFPGPRTVLLRTFPEIREGGVVKVQLYMRRGQGVRGSVKDENGGPIAGAQVEVVSQGIRGFHDNGGYWGKEELPPNRPVTSDTEGRFVLTLMPGSHVHLRVTAPGRPPEERSIDLLTHEGPITVTFGRGKVLRGRVLRPDGSAPSRDVHMVAFEPKEGGRVWTTESGPEGAFAFDGVVGDRVFVIASAYPLGGATARLVEDLGAPLDLVLGRTRTLRGKVVDGSGNPVPNALVSQEVVIKHPSFTADVSSHRLHEEARVTPREDGTLQVPAFVQTGVAQSDPEGNFLLETILDQAGGVRLFAFMREGNLSTGHVHCWVPLNETATLVCKPYPLDQEVRANADAPPPGSVESYLSSLKSAPLEDRRKLITEIRNELLRGYDRERPEQKTDRPELLPIFVASLDDEDHEVRCQAILGLSELHLPEALEPLTASLKHSDWTVRHYAIYGIAQLGGQSALKEKATSVLREVFMKEEDEDLRLTAATLLATLGVPMNPEIFYDALRGEDAEAYTNAAIALEKLGRKEAIELLIDCLKKSPGEHWVKEALKKLTGKPDEESALRWQAWLEENRASLPPQVPKEVEPSTPEQCLLAAQQRYANGDLDGAFRLFSKALELDPHCFPALNWRGYLHLERGNAESAIADFTKALALKSDIPEIWMYRANARALTKDTAGALADLEKTLAIAHPDWKYRETVERLIADLRKG